MKLVSPQYSFELSVLGYGQNNTTWRNRNKLQCEILTLWQKKTDKQSTPVQTYELAQMLNNLERLQEKQVRHVSSTLSDQNLIVDVYTLPTGKIKFQIQLTRTLTPAWHPYPDFPIEMDIVLDQKQLSEVIQQLKKHLSDYPER